MKNDFDTLQASLIAAKEEYEEKMRSGLHNLFDAFFKEHPMVRGIRWTQYTPYFNDGEACVFGLGEVEALMPLELIRGLIDHDTLDDATIDGEACSVIDSYGLKQKLPVIADALKKLKRCCNNLSDAMQAAFGDHVQVTATRAGFQKEEYEHE